MKRARGIIEVGPNVALTRHLAAVNHPELADPGLELVITYDTREKPDQVYRLTGVAMLRKCMETGDYGYLPPAPAWPIAAGERKALPDLIACQTHENLRHQEQLKRLSDLDFGFVIVEGSLEDIEKHRYYAPRAEPARILDTLATLQLKYPRVPYFFCGNRKSAAGHMYRLLRAHWLKTRQARQDASTIELEATLLAKGAP